MTDAYTSASSLLRITQPAAVVIADDDNDDDDDQQDDGVVRNQNVW